MKSSRLGVGSLIRSQASDGLRTVSGDPRFLIIPYIDFLRIAVEESLPTTFRMREKNNYSENSLLEGFRQGKEKNFTEIFTRLYPALCYFALKITDNQSAAEDIAGESFLKVWDRREQFLQFTVLKSYLYTTTRNASINWLKKTQRQQSSDRGMVANNETQENYILEDIVRAELLREIYSALDNLPSQCSKIMTLLYVEGKSTKEIAEELNLTTGTVKSQKARGLMLLKMKLSYWLLFSLFVFLSYP